MKRLLVTKYADEGTIVEAMRGLMKLAHAKCEFPKELGVRNEELAVLAFQKEVKENAAIRVQLANLYLEALQNECIRHDVIKEAPVKLSAAIALAKKSQRILEKVKWMGTQAQSQ